MISKDQWVWYGDIGHFIGGSRCSFHMLTVIGKYFVSTIGEYYSKFNPTEMEPLGVMPNHFYETMVFEVGGRCKCGCGSPNQGSSSLECDRYITPKEANEGHIQMCLKYAEMQ